MSIELESGIFKSDLMRQTVSSDFSNSISQVIKKYKTSYIEKGFVTDEAITDFNISLRQNNLYEILECENQKEAYTAFMDKVSQVHGNFFPITKIK